MSKRFIPRSSRREADGEAEYTVSILKLFLFILFVLSILKLFLFILFVLSILIVLFILFVVSILLLFIYFTRLFVQHKTKTQLYNNNNNNNNNK